MPGNPSKASPTVSESGLTTEPAVQDRYEDVSITDHDDSGIYGTGANFSANQLETGGSFSSDYSQDNTETKNYSQDYTETKDYSSAGSGPIVGSPIIKKAQRSNTKGAVPMSRVRSALLGSGLQYIMISGFVNGAKGRKLLPSDLVKSSFDDIDLVQVNSFKIRHI